MEEYLSEQVQADINAYTALRMLEALSAALETGNNGTMLSNFLNSGMTSLLRMIESVKRCELTADMMSMGMRFRSAFQAIQRKACAWCAKLNRKVSYAFSRMGDILCCLLGCRDRTRPSASAGLRRRESTPEFRVRLINRITDHLRAMFEWIRDIALEWDREEGMAGGRILLGPAPAQFIEEADTRRGFMIMRLPSGRRELFNLTAAEWSGIMPLLTTTHPLGYAKLETRLQSRLTRHDAEGDEIRGDLYRLKQYIHAVGHGRGGTGEYFLAPHPRMRNRMG